jgi:hypothetical protein
MGQGDFSGITTARPLDDIKTWQIFETCQVSKISG